MEVKFCEKIIVTILLGLYLTQVQSDEPEKNLTEFQSSEHICTTCQCSTFFNLFSLNCTNRDFKYTLSNWPEHTNKTLRAVLSYNKITTLQCFPASNSSALISVDHCGIKFLATGLFENMKDVRFIDLSYNYITTEELSADKFKGPYNVSQYEPIEVRQLNLAYNQIHSLRQNLFEHMPRLNNLNLEGNNFKVIDIGTQRALTSIQQLSYLNLANNNLKELPSQMFRNMKNLVEINLSRNKLELVPNVLANLDTLQVLILDSNPIHELADTTFGGFKNLVELSMNNLSSVVRISSNTFTPMTKLRKVQLSNNKNLEFFEPDAFGLEPPSIRELYMNNNGLIDLPAVMLDWSLLHVLEFNDNPLLCSCNLYRISKILNGEITRMKAGPYCIGEEERSYQVYSLDDRVCSENYIGSFSFTSHLKRNYSLIRIFLITLSIAALTATFIALMVCFLKQRKYGILENQLGRSTTVLYNPLAAQPSL